MAFLSAPTPFLKAQSSNRLTLSPTRSRFNVCAPRRRFSRIQKQICTPTAAYKAKQVTADELERVLQANERPVLVDAFATWCGPCQFLLPQLDIVADRFQDKLDILKIDTEKFPDLATALMVRGLPTLFFIKDGELKYRMEGAMPAEELEHLINYFLFDGPPPPQMEQLVQQ